jgi:hypothetical protein
MVVHRLRSPEHKALWGGATLLAGAASLYIYTLAPTLLWGDDAMFQRALAMGALTNHPVWGVLARLFARLPWGDCAFRANLVSAACAVAAIGALFFCTRSVGGSVRAACVAGGSLAISHTFWLEAVRAEVYTLHLFLFLAGLGWLLRWHRNPASWPSLVLGLALWFIGTVNHLLLTMAFVGGAWLLWTGVPRPRRGRAILVGALLAVGGALLTTLLAPTVVNSAVLDFVLANFRLSPRWTLAHLMLFIYQFPFLMVLAILGFRRLYKCSRDIALSLALVAIPTSVFAITHGILESYVFHLPVYALIALCIGLGSESFSQGWSWRKWFLMVAVILLLTVGVYRGTPMLLERFAPRIIYARDLPGRSANEFFLWPPKRGYLGARWFAESTLRLVAPEAIVMADWTPFAPLQYLQDVEGQRPDVLLVHADSHGVQVLREFSGRRPLFLANADPRYYPMNEIEEHFRLEPVGHIQELKPREGNP